MYLIADGGITGLPKNTKESVLLSNFDNNIDGVLVDVRMTNDNKLVLYENDLIFNNMYISKMSYQDLKKINIGNDISNYYIPSLEEILLYYDKDILIIKLHHNYDQNENLVLELKRILSKYYVKRLIVVVDNNNLYDYLDILTDYEIYNLNNSNNFLTIDVIASNYNGNLVHKLVSNNGNQIDQNKIFNEKNDIYKNYFILTNNSKLLRNYYL